MVGKNVLPVADDEIVEGQLVEEKGDKPIVARMERHRQFAVQKRKKVAGIDDFAEDLSLVATTSKNTKVIIVETRTQIKVGCLSDFLTGNKGVG